MARQSLRYFRRLSSLLGGLGSFWSVVSRGGLSSSMGKFPLQIRPVPRLDLDNENVSTADAQRIPRAQGPGRTAAAIPGGLEGGPSCGVRSWCLCVWLSFSWRIYRFIPVYRFLSDIDLSSVFFRKLGPRDPAPPYRERVREPTLSTVFSRAYSLSLFCILLRVP